jgi:ethanolamine utilization cobalamin adenosyltransferase
MNSTIIREVETLYTINQNFLSDNGLEEKHQRRALNRSENLNSFPKDPERYLKKDQLMGIFKDL